MQAQGQRRHVATCDGGGAGMGVAQWHMGGVGRSRGGRESRGEIGLGEGEIQLLLLII